jgi:hypothetical protein
MADFVNETPFGASVRPSSDRDGLDLLLIVVAAHFELPEPDSDEPVLRLFGSQDPPPMVEDYFGEPGQSSIRRDAQSSYTKPATDISICGDACAPQGEPVTAMNVSVRVGPCAVVLRVHGDRVWRRSPKLEMVPSAPDLFVKMPLVWERAYGGVAAGSTPDRPAFEPRNPIGCGLQLDANLAAGTPVPNIEDPRDLLTSMTDRPRPIGTGPVARHWQPRLSYAGTYDDSWRRRRAPLWPADFDERFFCGAPSYLQASPHLTGGEFVHLQGLHADGPIEFRLPMLRLVSLSRFLADTVTRTLVLDGVLIETDVGRLTMYYRGSVPAPRALLKHRQTSLRLLRPAESAVPQ